MRKFIVGFGNEVAECVALGGFVMFFAGLIVLTIQCVNWLREGYWTPLPLSRFLPANEILSGIEWRGVARMVEWFLGMSLSGSLCLVGMLIVFVTLTLAERD